MPLKKEAPEERGYEHLKEKFLKSGVSLWFLPGNTDCEKVLEFQVNTVKAQWLRKGAGYGTRTLY